MVSSGFFSPCAPRHSHLLGSIVFVVNCLVFVLIGIQLPVIAESLLGQQALLWPRIVGLIGALSRSQLAYVLWISRRPKASACWYRPSPS